MARVVGERLACRVTSSRAAAAATAGGGRGGLGGSAVGTGPGTATHGGGMQWKDTGGMIGIYSLIMSLT